MARPRTHDLSTPEARRAYHRTRQAAYRETVGKSAGTREFIGVDGEGGQDAQGHHQYYLLTAGTASLATGLPLTSEECLTFLSNLEGHYCYVAYFFDYDVTMICRGMPEDRVRRLLDRQCRTFTTDKGREVTMPLDWGDFQLDYLPHKEFKVRRWVGGQDRHGAGRWTPWVVVNDVGSFYQQAFIKTLHEWGIGTPEEREQIAVGKEARADFGQLTQDILLYNRLEIRLLQDLMDAFREVCKDVGYLPARWQGPGNLASAMLRKHGVKRGRDLGLDPNVTLMANRAYYGGRFETTAVGEVRRKVWQYDINSAYPAALVDMPCLEHGHWTREAPQPTSSEPFEGLSLHYGHFTHKEDALLYGYPIRTKQGTITYPSEGLGWYWSDEIRAAVHQSFKPSYSWWFRPQCECVPFSWVPEVYQQRLTLGKTARGKVLKLGLNSLYGKMAQSIGSAPYANPIYAGLITARTRAKLSEACHTRLPDGRCTCSDVLMLATDAVFSLRELPHLEVSKRLGEWDLDTHDSMFIVQPGLYFTGTGATAPKTRGLPRQAVMDHEDAFRTAYSLLSVTNNVLENTVRVPLRQFVGLRVAYHRGDPSIAGEWQDVPNGGKEVSFEWHGKRHPQITWFEGPTLRTIPQQGGPELQTVPYDKDIGRMLANVRMDSWDQPDWSPVLFGEEL